MTLFDFISYIGYLTMTISFGIAISYLVQNVVTYLQNKLFDWKYKRENVSSITDPPAYEYADESQYPADEPAEPPDDNYRQTSNSKGQEAQRPKTRMKRSMWKMLMN